MNDDDAYLPRDWALLWLRGDEPAPPGAIDLRWRTRSDAGRSAAMAFWRAKLAPWGAALPLGKATLVVRDEPVLDEVWTLWMLATGEAGKPLDASWAAACQYVEDVAQGFWPDRVPVEYTVQSVFRAMATLHLSPREPDRAEFLRAALGLCRIVATKLARGTRLLDDAICGGEPSLERYVSVLDADHKHYLADLRHAQRFWAEVGDQDDPAAPPRRLPLLVLNRPVAVQFKMWARSDWKAPGKDGYPLLLVDVGRNEIVLTASPTAHVTLSWLAPMLTRAEAEVRGVEGAVWYDGGRHSGTLVASPKDGTFLSLADVVKHLRGPLRLRRFVPPRVIALLSALAAALVIAGIVALRRPPDPRGSPLAAVRLDDHRGRRFALVAGACDYPEGHRLEYACSDARQVRDLLVDTYGYAPEDMIYLVDKPKPGEASQGAPTVERMEAQIEELARSGHVKRESSFVFYYSGHGGYSADGKEPWGFLEPTGYYERPELSRNIRGWDMAEIPRFIRKTLRARHVLILLDNCFSGMARGAKGGAISDDSLHEHWAADVDIVMTASDDRQLSYESQELGGSTFTHVLLQGLTLADGALPADTSGDGLVTDQELFGFVLRTFEAMRPKGVRGSTQRPQFKRLQDGERDRVGQFVFVPRAAPKAP